MAAFDATWLELEHQILRILRADPGSCAHSDLELNEEAYIALNELFHLPHNNSSNYDCVEGGR